MDYSEPGAKVAVYAWSNAVISSGFDPLTGVKLPGLIAPQTMRPPSSPRNVLMTLTFPWSM